MNLKINFITESYVDYIYILNYHVKKNGHFNAQEVGANTGKYKTFLYVKYYLAATTFLKQKRVNQ